MQERSALCKSSGYGTMDIMNQSLHDEHIEAVDSRLAALSKRAMILGVLRLLLLIILFAAGARLAATGELAAMLLSFICFILFLMLTARHVVIDHETPFN
jgi:hypothetical protein